VHGRSATSLESSIYFLRFLCFHSIIACRRRFSHLKYLHAFVCAVLPDHHVPLLRFLYIHFLLVRKDLKGLLVNSRTWNIERYLTFCDCRRCFTQREGEASHFQEARKTLLLVFVPRRDFVVEMFRRIALNSAVASSALSKSIPAQNKQVRVSKHISGWKTHMMCNIHSP
jgi:hypothetical protein